MNKNFEYVRVSSKEQNEKRKRYLVYILKKILRLILKN